MLVGVPIRRPPAQRVNRAPTARAGRPAERPCTVEAPRATGAPPGGWSGTSSVRSPSARATRDAADAGGLGPRGRAPADGTSGAPAGGTSGRALRPQQGRRDARHRLKPAAVGDHHGLQDRRTRARGPTASSTVWRAPGRVTPGRHRHRRRLRRRLAPPDGRVNGVIHNDQLDALQVRDNSIYAARGEVRDTPQPSGWPSSSGISRMPMPSSLPVSSPPR